MQDDIVETAKGAGIFKTLLTAATEAGLVDTLKGPGLLTAVRPRPTRRRQVPTRIRSTACSRTRAKLKEVLLYHVVKGKVTSGEVVGVEQGRHRPGKPVSSR
ncbi:MAG: fasciclin domain-containing protein [Isosphaeraceae bacterium]